MYVFLFSMCAYFCLCMRALMCVYMRPGVYACMFLCASACVSACSFFPLFLFTGKMQTTVFEKEAFKKQFFLCFNFLFSKYFHVFYALILEL